MRYVARNTPFVVRRAATEWEAAKTWNAGVLKDALSGDTVNVAVTPKGYMGFVITFPQPFSSLLLPGTLTYTREHN